jgi:4-aminobutyrate aminotransferase-like enzyme
VPVNPCRYRSCASRAGFVRLFCQDETENRQSTAAYFKARLQDLKDKHDLIGDVRGVGLALGVELVRDRKTLEPAASEAKRLVNLVREEGVLIGSEGVLGNILKLRPPVVLQPAQVDVAVAALERALARL